MRRKQKILSKKEREFIDSLLFDAIVPVDPCFFDTLPTAAFRTVERGFARLLHRRLARVRRQLAKATKN
jgi:hypothetical protein